MTNFEKTSRWIIFRRWVQITLLGMVSVWRALWYLKGESIVSGLALHLRWIDAALLRVAPFLGHTNRNGCRYPVDLLQPR